jgi:hypothetical protein
MNYLKLDASENPQTNTLPCPTVKLFSKQIHFQLKNNFRDSLKTKTKTKTLPNYKDD